MGIDILNVVCYYICSSASKILITCGGGKGGATLFRLLWFRFGKATSPSTAAPVPDPVIARAIHVAQQRRERTAVTEHNLLEVLDVDLAELQATLGKKLVLALKAERSRAANAAVLRQGVTALEEQEAELSAKIAALEAYLRATYPEYWKR